MFFANFDKIRSLNLQFSYFLAVMSSREKAGNFLSSPAECRHSREIAGNLVLRVMRQACPPPPLATSMICQFFQMRQIRIENNVRKKLAKKFCVGRGSRTQRQFEYFKPQLAKKKWLGFATFCWLLLCKNTRSINFCKKKEWKRRAEWGLIYKRLNSC